jgi:hypothetical protein
VLRNLTITVDEKALKWVRRQAAEEELSLSKFVARIIEHEMKKTDDYWKAFEDWKKIEPIPLDAKNRMTREEVHERQRR